MGQTVSSSSSSPLETKASCPMHREQTSSPSSGCPIQHDPTPALSVPAKCPIDHGQNLSPLNQMPDLPQERAPNQYIALPLSRTESSIPRDPSSKWEYPSPQQFYNALVRKGWETPEEHVETMVEIHNFLNEEAWHEVLKWEKRCNGCVSFFVVSQFTRDRTVLIICLPIVGMRTLTWQGLKVDREKYLQRPVSGYSLAGYYPLGSSEVIRHGSLLFLAYLVFTAMSHHLIVMTGSSAVQKLARKFVMS